MFGLSLVLSSGAPCRLQNWIIVVLSRVVKNILWSEMSNGKSIIVRGVALISLGFNWSAPSTSRNIFAVLAVSGSLSQTVSINQVPSDKILHCTYVDPRNKMAGVWRSVDVGFRQANVGFSLDLI